MPSIYAKRARVRPDPWKVDIWFGSDTVVFEAELENGKQKPRKINVHIDPAFLVAVATALRDAETVSERCHAMEHFQRPEKLVPCPQCPERLRTGSRPAVSEPAPSAVSGGTVSAGSVPGST